MNERQTTKSIDVGAHPAHASLFLLDGSPA